MHLFVEAYPKHSPSYVANQLKGLTSRVLREEFPHLRSRLPTLWSRSYIAAAVGTAAGASAGRAATACARSSSSSMAVVTSERPTGPPATTNPDGIAVWTAASNQSEPRSNVAT